MACEVKLNKRPQPSKVTNTTFNSGSTGGTK